MAPKPTLQPSNQIIFPCIKRYHNRTEHLTANGTRYAFESITHKTMKNTGNVIKQRTKQKKEP